MFYLRSVDQRFVGVHDLQIKDIELQFAIASYINRSNAMEKI